jgi:hypothetical protein
MEALGPVAILAPVAPLQDPCAMRHRANRVFAEQGSDERIGCQIALFGGTRRAEPFELRPDVVERCAIGDQQIGAELRKYNRGRAADAAGRASHQDAGAAQV